MPGSGPDVDFCGPGLARGPCGEEADGEGGVGMEFTVEMVEEGGCGCGCEGGEVVVEGFGGRCAVAEEERCEAVGHWIWI